MTTVARVQRTYHRRLLTPIERFSDGYEIDPSGCWIWKRSRRGKYGQFWLGKNMKSNRAAWLLFKGLIPENQGVLHTCDNPLCVNPSHLFLGTSQDNTDDMIAKGRDKHLSGENHPLSKLTESQVRIILGSTKMGKELAKEFNVGPMTISRIKRGLRWPHIHKEFYAKSG